MHIIMKKTYIKPETLIANVKVESMLAAVSGPRLSSTAADDNYGMDSKSRGSRNDDDFDGLW